METFSKSDRHTVVCLTPVKNEGWILERFLKCASLWADHIIIADQGSIDNSREIALQFPKVFLIENTSTEFNEPERQQLLIEAAREKIPGSRLLMALDADEIPTANFMDSPEWQTALQAPMGTVLRLPKVALRPDMSSYWVELESAPFGFVDDGSPHQGEKIHSTRVPMPDLAPSIYGHDVKVMHYQYANWERMQSKQRWYQCWEKLNRPENRPSRIYRRYHHMYNISSDQLYSIPENWFARYAEQEIDMTTIWKDKIYWWDQTVLDLIEKHGAETFRRCAMWDVDWVALSQSINPNGSSSIYQDPRAQLEKAIHKWLSKTQPIHAKYYVRFVDQMLAFFGW